MATLTIKPTAAGNDVQIKSGDGNTTHATFGDTSTVTLGTATITDATIADATIADATITAGTFPAGHVVQVKYLTANTQVSTTSQTFNTTDKIVMGTFTPLFASSDILLIGAAAFNANANAAYAFGDFYKNASDVTETACLTGDTLYGHTQMNDAAIWVTIPMIYLDTCSENSLSTKTYGYTVKCHSSSGSASVGWGTGGSAQETVLTLLEIAT